MSRDKAIRRLVEVRAEGEEKSGFVEIPHKPSKRPLSENELSAAFSLAF
jgi:hypothetical protein